MAFGAQGFAGGDELVGRIYFDGSRCGGAGCIEARVNSRLVLKEAHRAWLGGKQQPDALLLEGCARSSLSPRFDFARVA